MTVVTMLVCFYHFAHKAAGASGARHSPCPLIQRVGCAEQDSREKCAARSRSRGCLKFESRSVLRGCATRSPKGRSVVPLAGIEPALLAELDFESSASTNSATGASRDERREAGVAKPAEYSGRLVPVNPRRNRQIKVAFYRSSRSKHSGVNGHASTAARPRDRRLHTETQRDV